jgi:CxxC motif-containing protein
MSKGRKCRDLTCIVCPIGCKISVVVEGAEVVGLEGHGCARGKEHAHSEVLAPKRTLTSSILTIGGARPLVSVRTSRPIPKGKIPAVMKAIKAASVKAPVKAGDALIKNVAGTGADIIATSTVPKK